MENCQKVERDAFQPTLKIEELEILGKKVAEDSVKYLQIYNGGIQNETDDLGLAWALCSSREGVTVETSAVTDSFWQAVKAVSNISIDRMKILKLLTNDSRLVEYDDMFDFCQVIDSNF